MLRLVQRERVPCWPWRLREMDEARLIGEACVDCGRDVALSPDLKGRAPVCIYCALDTGLLPIVEIEP